MVVINLTETERKNLQVFLSRVDLKGSEALIFGTLLIKIQNAAQVDIPSVEPK